MPDRIKVIVCDDHTLFRTGVRASLEKKEDIEIIGEAENGAVLLQKLQYHQPHIVIMGISMPVMDGATAMPLIRKNFPAVKVIILSMHSDSSVISRMIELGANTYLTKEAGSEEIYKAILACQKNWFYANTYVRRSFLETTWGNDEFRSKMFWGREILILKMLQKNKTIEEIGKETHLGVKTSEWVIERLKNMMAAKNNDDLVIMAVKMGVIDEKESRSFIKAIKKIINFKL